MVKRLGSGFCPEPQPAGPGHIDRHTVVEDVDRILMQDQPSKFYYVITGAHGEQCYSVDAVTTCWTKELMHCICLRHLIQVSKNVFGEFSDP